MSSRIISRSQCGHVLKDKKRHLSGDFQETLRNLNLCFSRRAVVGFVLIGLFENERDHWLICKLVARSIGRARKIKGVGF